MSRRKSFTNRSVTVGCGKREGSSLIAELGAGSWGASRPSEDEHFRSGRPPANTSATADSGFLPFLA